MHMYVYIYIYIHIYIYIYIYIYMREATQHAARPSLISQRHRRQTPMRHSLYGMGI